MTNCGGKHTKYQPTMKEWKCPSCGANDNGEYFYIDTFAIEVSDPDCSLLHRDDVVVCTKCNKEWTGDRLSKLMAKITNMVPCPNCKGTGFVKKPSVR
jgi:DNA-directed RNA polymerase subunit RPC12/RpoP